MSDQTQTNQKYCCSCLNQSRSSSSNCRCNLKSPIPKMQNLSWLPTPQTNRCRQLKISSFFSECSYFKSKPFFWDKLRHVWIDPSVCEQKWQRTPQCRVRSLCSRTSHSIWHFAQIYSTILHNTRSHTRAIQDRFVIPCEKLKSRTTSAWVSLLTLQRVCDPCPPDWLCVAHVNLSSPHLWTNPRIDSVPQTLHGVAPLLAINPLFTMHMCDTCSKKVLSFPDFQLNLNDVRHHNLRPLPPVSLATQEATPPLLTAPLLSLTTRELTSLADNSSRTDTAWICRPQTRELTSPPLTTRETTKLTAGHTSCNWHHSDRSRQNEHHCWTSSYSAVGVVQSHDQWGRSRTARGGTAVHATLWMASKAIGVYLPSSDTVFCTGVNGGAPPCIVRRMVQRGVWPENVVVPRAVRDAPDSPCSCRVIEAWWCSSVLCSQPFPNCAFTNMWIPGSRLFLLWYGTFDGQAHDLVATEWSMKNPKQPIQDLDMADEIVMKLPLQAQQVLFLKRLSMHGSTACSWRWGRPPPILKCLNSHAWLFCEQS